MTIRFTDWNEVKGRIQVIAATFPARVARALVAEFNVELKECYKRTPVDTGALRETLRVEGPFFKGSIVSARIAAGGGDVNYAIVVHEDLSVYHRVGQAKFIESVLRESASYMKTRIAKRLTY